MHIVVGEISAVYTGRGETNLAPYNRIVIYKADGSVSIHGDKGFKPMNYMTASNEKIESVNGTGEKVWTFVGKKEQLVVTFHEIYDEIHLPLGMDDPGYSLKNGNETQLQAWLADNIKVIGANLTFVEREFQTGDGPVDLLAKEGEIMVPIEVKRSAPMNTVGQLIRYMDAIKEHHPDKEVKGIIAALEFKPKTLEIALKKGIECVVVPNNWVELRDGINNDDGDVVQIIDENVKGLF